MQRACKTIRELIKSYLKNNESTTNLDLMTKSIEQNLRFITTYSFDCIKYYLIIVMIYNFGHSLMICVSDFVNYEIIPGVTKFRMIKKASDPASEVYSKTPMISLMLLIQMTIIVMKEMSLETR